MKKMYKNLAYSLLMGTLSTAVFASGENQKLGFHNPTMATQKPTLQEFGKKMLAALGFSLPDEAPVVSVGGAQRIASSLKPCPTINVFACRGGGIRGWVTANVWAALEDALRKAGVIGEEEEIYKLCDGIIGSSTGGIIASSIAFDLAKRRKGDRNLLWDDLESGADLSGQKREDTAHKLIDIYPTQAPEIFNNEGWWGHARTAFFRNKVPIFSTIGKYSGLLYNLFWPKYDGVHLQGLFRDYFGDYTMLDTRVGHGGHKIQFALTCWDMDAGKNHTFDSGKVEDGTKEIDGKNGPQPNFLVAEALIPVTAQATYIKGRAIQPVQIEGQTKSDVGNVSRIEGAKAFNGIDAGHLNNPTFLAFEMALKLLLKYDSECAGDKDSALELLRTRRKASQRVIAAVAAAEKEADEKGKTEEEKEAACKATVDAIPLVERYQYPPRIRIIHMGTGFYDSVYSVNYDKGGILNLAPSLVATLLSSQGTMANETISFLIANNFLPGVEFYNLDAKRSAATLNDDSFDEDMFTSLTNDAQRIVGLNPDENPALGADKVTDFWKLVQSFEKWKA